MQVVSSPVLGVCKVAPVQRVLLLEGWLVLLSELSVAKEVRLGAGSAWDERGDENRGQPGVVVCDPRQAN